VKVLLLAENWPPRIGGIERYLTGIARSLPAGSVTVVAPRDLDARGSHEVPIIRRRFFWPGIKPSWLPLYFWLYRYVRREKIEVVLCGKALFEGLAARWLKRHAGVPYVVFTYGTEIITWAGAAKERRTLEKVLREAHGITFINAETRESLQQLGARDEQLVEAWPGVEERFFVRETPARVAQTLQRYQVTPPYILSVSRLIRRKGTDLLLEAFSNLDQTKFGTVTLVIAGEGPEQENLAQLARHLFVEKSVVFTGRVDEDDLPSLYQGAELFALTPRMIADDLEGFGIVYLEAAASGRAAIATVTGGVASAVVDGETGLVVPPDSADEIKQALARLLTDRPLAQRFGEQAAARARGQFSWAKRIAVIAAVIDRAAIRKI